MNTGAIITFLWVIWAAYWAASSFGNKRNVYRTSSLWRFSLFLVVVGVLALSRNFPAFYHQRLIPRADSVVLAGTILCAIGIAFSIWARVILGRNWSGNPTIKEGHELIQTGPYRMVRHPIYTGILMALLGTCLAGGRIRDLFLFLGVAILLAFKLRIEEALMLRQFPDDYVAYRKRTKALIPFIL